MNSGSMLFPTPTSSAPSRPVSAVYDEYPPTDRLQTQLYNYSNELPRRVSRPPANGRFSYPHQPFPLNPSPRHFLYPPYAQNPSMPSRRLPPPSPLDDPAFSSDPRANPHFAMTTGEQFIPLNSPASTIQASIPPTQDILYRHSRDGSARSQDAIPRHAHKITAATPPRLQPRAESAYYPEEALALPSVPPQQPQRSMAKLSKRQLAASETHIKSSTLQPLPPPYEPYPADTSSNSSCSSSSHSSASSVLLTPTSSPPAPVHSKFRSRLRVVNPEEDDRTNPVLAPPEYTDSKLSAHAILGDRPPLVANSSAPELRPPPATDIPPRPATVPVPPIPGSTINANLPTKRKPEVKATATRPAAAPDMRRQRSRKTSIAAAPKDLDRIDELDETDPLGFAWHHDGRYEAAMNALKASGLDEPNGAGVGAGNAKKMDQNGTKSSHRKPSPVDPSTTSFHISPGEIFPSFNGTSQQPPLPALQQQQQQFPPPIQRPSRQQTPQQQSSQLPPPASSQLFPQSQSRVQEPQPQPQSIPSSLLPGGFQGASRLDTNDASGNSSQSRAQRQQRNSSYLTVPTTNGNGFDDGQDDSELAYTLPSPLPSPSRSPLPNPYEQQQAQYVPTLQHQRLQSRLHKQHVPAPRPDMLPGQGARVRFQDQVQVRYDGSLLNPNNNNTLNQDPRFPFQRMPSPQPAPAPTRQIREPFLDDENRYNNGYQIQGQSALHRSTSAPNTPPPPSSRTPRPRLPPGLGPELHHQQQQQQIYSRSQERLDYDYSANIRDQQWEQQGNIPRPDIQLPSRHAAKQGPPAPHYLPKKLVMPTPLQPQQQQLPPLSTSRPSGMGMYGESASSANSGSSGESGRSGLGYSQSMSVPPQQVQQKKAKEIPISQGRNLLRKRVTIAGHPPPNANPDVGANVNLDGGLQGPGPLGPGPGDGYVPSSNATAAMFASKVGVPVASLNPGQGMGVGVGGGAGGDGWADVDAANARKIREREEKMRAKELERWREKEREREKPTGRKLSKRR